MNQTTLAILVVVGVAVIALLMRRGSVAPGAPGSTGVTDATPPSSDPGLADSADREPPENDDHEDIGAFTSDGWAFVPDGDEVQLVPPASPEDEIGEAMDRYGAVMADPETGSREGGKRRQAIGIAKPGEHLDLGDLIGARVLRGAPDTDPWRLEALGREGEYRAWAFETEDAARAALNLLERRIVRRPTDDDGEPSPPGDADYAVALALTQAGIAEVAMDPGDEEPAR